MTSKSIIRAFSSVKLTLFLIIILVVSLGIGTLIPQQKSSSFYHSHYGPWSPLFLNLQLNDLYHSVWFLTLLGMLILNTVACTIRRLSPKWNRIFRPQVIKEKKNIQTLSLCDHFISSRNIKKVKRSIQENLSSYHYRLREAGQGAKIYFLARKKIMGLWGPEIVHTGILIILLGGIVSGLGGMTKYLSLRPGEVASIPQSEYKIQLKNFDIERYPGGNIKDWKSTLSILNNGKPVLTQTIEVNHPLSYKGFLFYQNSWGRDWKNPSLEIWAQKKDGSSSPKTLHLKLRKKVELEEGLYLSVRRFLPDFVLTAQNKATSRSDQPRNPAAFIQGWRGNKTEFSGWIFARFPQMNMINSEHSLSWQFKLQDYSPNRFSVIQVSKDPGVNFIWAGSAVIMIGLLLAFYWHHREIRIIIEKINGQIHIWMGGTTPKGAETFKREFKEIVKSIRRKN
ncbi:cytochrome c biogenesis protein ResB [bacterium]|nr:cytochrome c biogenesis protein ResB [bacterium]